LRKRSQRVPKAVLAYDEPCGSFKYIAFMTSQLSAREFFCDAEFFGIFQKPAKPATSL
jgi:hypothetical protein